MITAHAFRTLLAMALIDRLPRFARLQFLGKYQEPGRFMAAGMAAGLLLFLAWWVFQPSLGAHAGVDATAGNGQTAEPTIGDGSGVLDGITGAPEPGRGVAEIAPGDEAGLGVDNGSASASVDPDPSADANDGSLAGADTQDPGSMDANASPPDAQGGVLPPTGRVTLVPFYVEVDRGQGVSEVLRIDAVSPEQALAILRDYRGDPRVLRGPSTQPFN